MTRLTEAGLSYYNINCKLSRFGLFSVQCFKCLLHFGRFSARLKAMQAVEAFDTVLTLVLRPKDAEFRHVDGLLLEQESYFPSDVKCNAIPPREPILRPTSSALLSRAAAETY